MSLKKQIISGSFWALAGQMGYMLVALITNIVLARFLTPFEFGQMGILMFFIAVAAIFTEGGFGGALVRIVEIKKEDYSTAFIINLLISIICFIALVSFSGVIANYYHDPSLKKLLTVTSLILFINAFNITQNARLIREMNFKKKYLIQFFANLMASIIAIVSAYKGSGVWSLIIFQLLTPAFNVLILFILDRNIYAIAFNKESFKELYSFGINTTLTSILATGFDNIYQLILGRYFSISQVGFYYQAKKLQIVPFQILNSVVQNVLFSSLSKLQNDKEKFIAVYYRLLVLFAVLMGTITAVIFLYAKSLILFLYGVKWEGAVFFMQLLSIVSFFYFQELFNNVIFKVFNQTKKIFYLEIAKKIIQIISIIIGLITLNLAVLLYGFVISSIISYGLNFYYSSQILGKNTRSEIIAVIKIAGAASISVIMCRVLFYYFHLDFKTSLYVSPLFFLVFILLLRISKIDFFVEFKLAKKYFIKTKK